MRTIYWLRFEKCTDDAGWAKTDHEVEFGTSEELNGALAELHHYDLEDFALAASGERDAMFYHVLQVPREWKEFREAAILYKNTPRVLSAKDAEAYVPLPSGAQIPVKIPKGWPPTTDHESFTVAFEKEKRYPHYAQMRGAILLASAAFAGGAIYWIVTRWLA